MTASKIIEEIKQPDPKEQLDVIRFAYQLDAERRLTGKELSSLAERMARSPTGSTPNQRFRTANGSNVFRE
jgi:hypothetical protein